MFNEFTRTGLLIGDEGLEKLSLSKVAVFGIGGVGAFTAEALARAGVGNLTLVDYDLICITNINRQIHATHKTIGLPKVTVMKERILDINPKATVEAVQKMYTLDTAEELISGDYTYIVDAIDMVTSKIELIVQAKKMGLPIISSMGAGNKLDPTKFLVADIYDTSVCPLAKVMRKELRRRGVPSLKVVYSKEEPVSVQKNHCLLQPNPLEQPAATRRNTPGSISFVPSVAGLIIAGQVVNDIVFVK